MWCRVYFWHIYWYYTCFYIHFNLCVDKGICVLWWYSVFNSVHFHTFSVSCSEYDVQFIVTFSSTFFLEILEPLEDMTLKISIHLKFKLDNTPVSYFICFHITCSQNSVPAKFTWSFKPKGTKRLTFHTEFRKIMHIFPQCIQMPCLL